MSKFDYSKIKEYKIYDHWRGLLKFYRSLNYKVEYRGQENIPAEGGLIVASNHVQALDPLLICLGIENRQTHFMAKKEVFSFPVIGHLFKFFGAFPVNRGAADLNAVRYASKLVKEGYVLGIFPEGTRSKDGKMQRAKRGISTIAAASKGDILPVHITNDSNFKKHSKTVVTFGNVIKYDELGLDDEPTREQMKKAADLVMEKIAEL